jgi:hypothetical protein
MAYAGRNTHDFRLYEESAGSAIAESIKVQGGSGYEGILKVHRNSEIPKKNRKDGVFRGEEKGGNREIGGKV